MRKWSQDGVGVKFELEEVLNKCNFPASGDLYQQDPVIITDLIVTFVLFHFHFWTDR